MSITIHPSRVADELACEKAGVWRMLTGPTEHAKYNDHVHVASWIGSAVHARVAEAAEPPPDELLVYDELTPTMRRARAQVDQLAEAVSDAIRQRQWDVVAHELNLGPITLPGWPPSVDIEGTADLLTRNRRSGRGILSDVKTSRDVYPGWLQLGCYALLYDAVGIEGPPGVPHDLEGVAIVHAPRPATLLAKPHADVLYAPVTEVVFEARKALARLVTNLIHPNDAPAAPGTGCRWCPHPTCVVRERHYAPRNDPTGESL
ncbi:MAG: PD-(D/E)XK nuclease family protein [Thiotrichales bacterium]|nr:PD-(D/E)XK nuclease family protein [Thiotrichales bacterium]